MSVALSAGTLALAPKLSTFFLGSGGTAPYTYAVLTGGAGGSIDSTTGEYTAPSSVGAQTTDTIEVTDFLGAIADATIKIGNPLQLFCDILQSELGLTDDQVYIWDQKIDIPKDSRLYIAVGVLSEKPFSNTTQLDGSGAALNAIQSTNVMAILSVDILSRGPSARDRKEEIIMALNSIYAQQQQEINSFYIAKLSNSFVALNLVDGAAILNRFNISIGIQYVVTKVKAVPYFDTFSQVSLTVEP